MEGLTGCTPDAFPAAIDLSLLVHIRPTLEFTRFPLFVELLNRSGLFRIDVDQWLRPAHEGCEVGV